MALSFVFPAAAAGASLPEEQTRRRTNNPNATPTTNTPLRNEAPQQNNDLAILQSIFAPQPGDIRNQGQTRSIVRRNFDGSIEDPNNPYAGRSLDWIQANGPGRQIAIDNQARLNNALEQQRLRGLSAGRAAIQERKTFQDVFQRPPQGAQNINGTNFVFDSAGQPVGFSEPSAPNAVRGANNANGLGQPDVRSRLNTALGGQASAPRSAPVTQPTALQSVFQSPQGAREAAPVARRNMNAVVPQQAQAPQPEPSPFDLSLPFTSLWDMLLDSQRYVPSSASVF